MRALHAYPTPLLLAALLCAASLLPACATRTVNETVATRYGLEIKLRSEKKLFGAETPRGFAHPSIISPARLEVILGGIEIDVRKSEDSPIRVRRKAIPPKLLRHMSESLSDAFANANADQEIVVLSLRKEMQHGIFNRKFLTSFTTYLKDDRLYVYLSRVDWPVEERHKKQKLPDPRPGDNVMPFITVPNDYYAEAGRQAVAVDWRSGYFDVAAAEARRKTPPRPRTAPEPSPEVAPDTADVAAGAEAGVAAGAGAAAGATPAPVGTSPAPGPEAAGTAAASSAASAPPPEAASNPKSKPKPEPSDSLRSLTADDYRALADLEEKRGAGQISDAEYESAREAVLKGAR